MEARVTKVLTYTALIVVVEIKENCHYHLVLEQPISIASYVRLKELSRYFLPDDVQFCSESLDINRQCNLALLFSVLDGKELRSLR